MEIPQPARSLPLSLCLVVASLLAYVSADDGSVSSQSGAIGSLLNFFLASYPRMLLGLILLYVAAVKVPEKVCVSFH